MSPRNATTSRATGQRFYSWRGEAYWSVTTIIGGGLPKPALINWAKKFTAEYAVTNLSALNELVTADPDGAVDWLKNAAFRDRDRKATIGSAVHEATEAHVLGKPFPKWPAEIMPRMEGFLRFLNDWNPVYIATEASVYNRTQRYAGTLDAICQLDGRRVLLDAKSSAKGVYPDAALQMAAYRNAEFIGLPDGSEEPMWPVDAAAVLHLPGDGGYQLIEVDAGPEVFTSFLYVREVFRWMNEGSKSCLLGPLRQADDESQLALANAVAVKERP